MQFSFRLCLLLPLLQLTKSKESLDFLMIGDWGGIPEKPYTTPGQTKVAAQMAQWALANSADFVLGLGDNFYFSGVEDDHSERFSKTWENVYLENTPSLQIPWYLVAGNHDWGGNVSAQIAYSDLNEHWNFPDYSYEITKEWTESDGKTYSVQIVMIDTIQLSGNTGIYDESDPKYFEKPILTTDMQKALSASNFEWIDKVMSESTADYLLVAGHYPVYSVCDHGSSDLLISNLKPLLEKYQAHYLSGHDHCQEHLSENNVEYILSGNADFCCYDASKIDEVPSDTLKFLLAKKHNPTHAIGGFSSFSASSGGLEVIMYNHHGDIVYNLPTILPRNK